MIDLHTHTDASDGRCTPAELVARAAAAGVTVLAVTDHDTVAAADEASAACATSGLEFVTGIEITSVVDDADVHVLGYFIDLRSQQLTEFLSAQRRRRIDRVREIVGRLAAHGIVLDAESILRPVIDDPARAVGRPWVARALVAAGHVADTDEAFGLWLERGRPAFVPRMGASPEEVITRIHDADGIASLAHPALVRRDEWLPALVAVGLDALEAYHSDHDRSATARYVSLAARLGIAVTGGSDYHADDMHGSRNPGSVSLPLDAYEKLVRLKTERSAHRGQA